MLVSVLGLDFVVASIMNQGPEKLLSTMFRVYIEVIQDRKVVEIKSAGPPQILTMHTMHKMSQGHANPLNAGRLELWKND